MNASTKKKRKGGSAASREKEAVQAARRASRGETVERLGRAEAASLPGYLGVGVPLNDATRERLETSFRADLGAVRLHHGRAADRFTHERGALAATAGRHVVFSDHAPDTETSAGFELLAHEVAHALQQTGRRSVDGLLAVTPASGTGEPQNFDREVATGTDEPALTELWHFHREATDEADRPRLEEIYEQIRGAYDDGVDTSASFDELEADVLASDYNDEPHAVRSFLYDALKFRDRIDGAAYLHLDRDWSLKSIRVSDALVARIAEQFSSDTGILNRVLIRSGTVTAEIRNVFKAEFRRTYFQLGRAQPRAEPIATALREKLIERVGANPNQATRFINERVVAAYTYHQEAAYDFYDTSHAAPQTVSERIAQIRTRREGVRDALAEADPNPLQARVVRWEIDVLDDALDFWLASQSVIGMVSPTELGVSQTLTFSRTDRRRVARALEPLGDKLVEALEAGLDPDDVRALDLTAYRTSIDGLKEAVATAISAVDRQLARVGGWNRRRRDRALALASTLGFLSLMLEHANSWLERDQARVDVDDALIHRLQLAWQTQVLGVALAEVDGASRLVEAGRRVDRGDDVQDSYLAASASWEEDTWAELEQMEEDFELGLEQLGVPIRTLISLYRLAGITARISELRPLVRGGNLPDHADVAGAGERGRAAAQQLQPERWIIPDEEIVLRSNDSTLYYDVISDHPGWSVIEREMTSNDYEVAYPQTNSFQGEVFVWLLPDPTDIFAHEWFTFPEEVREAGIFREFAQAEGLAAFGQLLRGSEDEALLLASFQQAISALWEHQQEQMRELNVMMAAHQRRNIVDVTLANLERADNRNQEHSVVLSFESALAELHRTIRSLGRNDEADEFYKELADLNVATAIWQGGSELSEALEYLAGLDLLPAIRLALELSSTDRETIVHDVMTQRSARVDFLMGITNADVREDLQNARSSLRERLFDYQQRIGIIGTESDGLRNIQFEGAWLALGTPFVVDGMTVRIDQVHVDFAWLPSMGRNQFSDNEGLLEESWRALDSDGDLTSSELSLSADSPILTIAIQTSEDESEEFAWRTIELTYGDHDLLTRFLAKAVRASISVAIGSIPGNIWAAFRAATDLMEFLPVIGGGVAIFNAALSAIEFIASDEFDDLLDTFLGDPAAPLERLVEVFGENFDAEQMFHYFLYEDTPDVFARARRGREEHDRRRRRSRRQHGRRRPSVTVRLGRILMKVLGAVFEFLDMVARARDRVQDQLFAVRATVLTRPLVYRSLIFVLEHFAWIEAAAGAVANPGDAMGDARRELDEAVDSMLEAFDAVEPPPEILDLHELVAVIGELVAERLGRKGEMAYEAVEAIGLTDEVYARIAAAIRGTEWDPNTYWVEMVKPTVDDAFDQIKSEFQDGFQQTLQTAFSAGSSDSEADSEVESPVPGSDGSVPAGPQMQPSMASGKRPRHLPRFDTSGGARLDSPRRTRFERSFGVSMDHVRIHSDRRTERELRRTGADAVTSGSHVFVRDGKRQDDQLLAHELTHVVQQTGAPDGSRPVAPTSGAGLRVDPQLEAEAERASQDFGTRPVSVTGATTVAPQPSFSRGEILEFVRFVTNRGEAEELAVQARINRGSRSDGVFGGIGEVIEDIRVGLRGLSAGDIEARFGTGPAFTEFRRELIKHIKNHSDQFVNSSAHRNGALIALADVAIHEEMKGEQKVRVFNVDRFRTAFIEFFAFAYGVRLRFDIDVSSQRSANVEYDPTNRRDYSFQIENLEIVGLDLAPISGRARNLWDLMTGDSGNDRRAWRKLIEEESWQNEPELPDDKATLRRVIQDISRRQGGLTDGDWYSPSRESWEHAAAPFSTSFRRKVIAELKAQDSGAEATIVQRMNDEANPITWERYTGAYLHGVGQPSLPGFYLGKHGDNAGQMAEIDRESHHTTQYLLIEYFSGKHASRKPFEREVDYPGVSGAHDDVSHVDNPSGDALEVSSFGVNSARGPEMPAVTLHKTTHSRAIHIDSTPGNWPDDSTADSTLSQSNTVHGWFRDKVESNSEFVEKEAAERDGTAEGFEENDTEMNRVIVDAMLHTYRQIREHMLADSSALVGEIREKEIPLYEHWANQCRQEVKDSIPEATDTIARRVVGMIRDHNDDLMSNKGWTEI